MPQLEPSKAGDGGAITALLSFVLSLFLDHWIEVTTLALSAVGVFWGVKNYRANIAVKRLEAEKLKIEISSMRNDFEEAQGEE